jgi:hypothetical protein
MAATTPPKKGLVDSIKGVLPTLKGMVSNATPADGKKLLGTGTAAGAATAISDYQRKQKAALDEIDKY